MREAHIGKGVFACCANSRTPSGCLLEAPNGWKS